MGLFKKIRSKIRHYDMDTLEGINAIPVPAKDYNTGDPTKDCIYYVLQRKATEHKKAGDLDLAIACLKKSNELSDYEKHPLLSPKEYLRLVKYMQAAGYEEKAAKELQFILTRHPEFTDKRISSKQRMLETLENCRTYNEDLIILNTNNHCPICSQYNGAIFSISGKSKKFSKLPRKFITDGGFCKDCFINSSIYFEGITSARINIED